MADAELRASVSNLTWGMFLLIVLTAIFIAAGVPIGPLAALGLLFALAFSFRYIHFVFYLAIALVPMLGVMLMIPTGSLALGQRAFGGSIDVSLAEVILFFALAAWMLRVLFYWRRRRDWNWRPSLPLLSAYFPLVVAHALSAFSPLQPDVYVAYKFALRPVLFSYLAFIALPVNLLRSRRRIMSALAVIGGVGVLAALNGLLSMFFQAGPGNILGRAQPLAIFGIHAFGENHNELADFLVYSAPFTLALVELVKAQRTKRIVYFLAAFQFAIGLFTFTRTIWISFILQGVFVLLILYRAQIRKLLPRLAWFLMLMLPLGIGMFMYSASDTARSSNSTRLMLSQIAVQVFTTSPVFGGGAGTFLDRVGSTKIFLLEYGDPLDSHGFLQKLMAETGILGLAALAWFVFAAARWFRVGWKRVSEPAERKAYAYLMSGALGAFIYQLLNTDYWTGKMWLPLGMALAAGLVFGANLAPQEQVASTEKIED